jgi:phage/plasmid-like protein (TIGR03299 family)
MSHEIETIAYAHKVGSNVASYQTPWHSLGTPVSNDLTPMQMMDKAQLNWTVDRIPTFARIGDVEVPTGKEVLVRSSDNKILTHVSEDWQPVQNHEAFDFFTEFVMSGNMEMNTAGSLKGGNMVWALAKIKDGSFDLFKGKDVVDSYLLFSNPHEYGKCIDIRFTAIRVVCNNTLTLALNAKSDMVVRLNHRRKFDAEMVKNTLGLASNNTASYKEMAEYIGTRKFSVDKLMEYYNEVFPTLSKKEDRDPSKLSRPAQTALEVLDTQPGAELGKGTWWQAFNSATFTIDHLLGRSDDTRLTSAWYGQNRQKKVEALRKAVEYADA